ncbi:MAG: hypothetical protein IJ935_08350 [Afipia sp.]|nr:hypothetical protein [Afipia sp.]
MQTNPFQAWLAKVGWEIAVAVALAAALAISTGATSTLFFRYLAGASGLGSLVQAAVAIARGRPLTERLSEWDEAIVLATMSAGAHLIAGHLD